MASGNQLKARLPRGFIDRTADEIKAAEKMLGKIRQQFELYGFEPVETPLIEYTDALGKFLPDQDRPNEGVFSFQDDDEQWLSLRYDLTAPLARFSAENWEKLPKPYRSYRNGWVFRNEKPGPGRFRQFMQFDADIVGAPTVAADAEICMLMADTLEALGLWHFEEIDDPENPGQKKKTDKKVYDFIVKVNSRKVLDGVMEAIGIGGDENAGKRLSVLRSIDKLDRLGVEGVRLLLGAGRKDESGDFTKGAGLNEAQTELILRVITFSPQAVMTEQDFGDRPWHDMAHGDYHPNGQERRINNFTTLDIWSSTLVQFSQDKYGNAEPTINPTAAAGIEELRQLIQLCENSGFGSQRIRIDPSVVRGLEYYTGPVYEAELTFEVPNEDRQIVQFGSVGGGGRYDGLVSRFLKEPVPSTGFSIGVSRLMTALKAIKSPILGLGESLGPIVVVVVEKDPSAPAQAQSLVTQLRAAGIRAEMYLGEAKKLGTQIKYADRRKSPCVIMQWKTDWETGVVQIKDLIEGARLASGITDNKEWRESRPAQVTIPVTEMVATVKDILARYAPEPSGV